MYLDISQKQLGKRSDQLAGHDLPIEFVEGVYHSVFGPTADLVLINYSLEQLVVHHNDVSFFLIAFHVSFGYFG